MRKELLRIMVFCAACLVLGAQGQNSASDPSAPGSPTAGSPDSSIGSPSSSQSSPSARYSATGRMGQQEVRASKLMGVQVRSSSGESLGTINDVILNPTSGRIDFAVISLGSSFSSSSTPGTSDTASQSSPSSTLNAANGGKLLAVPWNLLRSSGAIGYGATSGGGQTTASSSISGQQQIFVFTGDKSKLQAAPSFDQSNWPDMSGSWRQSIHSYYGVQQDSSTGAASSPGGVGSSSGTSSSSSTVPSSSDSSSSSDSPSNDSSSTPDSSSTGKP